MSFSVTVQTENFNVGREYDLLVESNTSIGAVVFFVGRVRDFNNGINVSALSLEHYPGMTEKVLWEIMEEARLRWPLSAARIVHRVGDLYLGDQIVFVGTASAHREHAFQSAEFLMDFLKTKAPFWKKEECENGKIKWIDATDLDAEKLKRWK